MPRVHTGLYDWLVLKPVWLGFLILAVYYCFSQEWFVGIILGLAGSFAVGMLAASLHRSKSFRELAAGHPSRDEAFGNQVGELSYAESRQIAWVHLRLGLVVGLTVAGLAFHHHVRWYLAVLAGFFSGWLGLIVLFVPYGIVVYCKRKREG